MPRSTTPRWPWALLALCLAIITGHLVVLSLALREPQIDLLAADGYANMLAIPSFVPLVALGALIVARHPGNRFGWLICAIGLGWETFVFANTYAVYGYGAHDGNLFGGRFALWMSGWLFYPILCMNVAFIPLLFPSGRPPSGRWRVVFWLAVVGTVSSAIGFAVTSVTIEIPELGSQVKQANPYGTQSPISIVLQLVGTPLVIASSLAAGGRIVWHLRHLGGAERQQMKWIAYTGAIAAVVFAFNTFLFVIETPFANRFLVVQILSFAVFPIAAGIAIVRHRLFDIDLLIRRTLVYGALSVCLLSTYLALVLILGDVIRRMTGGESGVVVAASTLAVAALFQPLRSRIQRGVDRRFNRSRYDAERALEAFSSRLSEQVDLVSLCEELQEAVTETMQPAHVSLWLLPADRNA